MLARKIRLLCRCLSLILMQAKPTNAIALNFNPVHSFWWCNLGLQSNLPTHWRKYHWMSLNSIYFFEKCQYYNWLSLNIETNWSLEHQNYAKNSLEEDKVNDDFAEASVLHYFHQVQMPYKYNFLQIHKYKTFCPQIKLFTSRKCKLAQH